MAKNQDPPNLNLIISQTKALSWDDITLENETEAAEPISNHTLIGKMISSKPLNKHTFHTIIKAIWSFIPGLIIEDLDINTYLFTFPSQ